MNPLDVVNVIMTAAAPIIGHFGRKQQHEYNKELFQMQSEHNKEMADIEQGYNIHNMKYSHDLNEISADNAQQRGIETYKQTQSSQAKVKEMEQAGLSVGLLQGTPSQGGASAGAMGNTGTLAGARPQPAIMQGMDIAGMYTNLMKTSAEIANINADTAKKKEETTGQEYQNWITQIEGDLKRMEVQNKQIEFEIMNSTWTDGNGNKVSLITMAKRNDTFEEFIRNLSATENKDVQDALKTEQGKHILKDIFMASRHMDNALAGIEYNKENWQFQRDIIRELKNVDFAKLSAKEQAETLRANISTAELTKQQKDAWNEILNKIENENIKNGLIVLAMIANQMACNWHMPNRNTYNTNNYVNNE